MARRLARPRRRLDTATVTPEVRYARSGDVSIAYQVIEVAEA